MLKKKNRSSILHNKSFASACIPGIIYIMLSLVLIALAAWRFSINHSPCLLSKDISLKTMSEKKQLTSLLLETIMFALLLPPADLFISLYFTIINHTIRKNNSV